MTSKMQNQKSLEQQVQIASSDLELSKDKELEAMAGGGLDNLSSLRGKVAKWAAVAASVVGIISVGMVPAYALNRARCEPETFNVYQGSRPDYPNMCFANAGEIGVVIADVHRLYSGNNAGFVITNKGSFSFGKREIVDFLNKVGPVTILQIGIK